jgi:hypothetical protein
MFFVIGHSGAQIYVNAIQAGAGTLAVERIFEYIFKKTEPE